MSAAHWERVKALFGAALEHEPAARAAFLEASCGPSDGDVRREVEALLAAHQESGSFLQTPAAVIGGLDTPEHSVLRDGHTVGPYRVLDLLGVGGMGQVYLAEDPRLGRKVALKLLPRDLASDSDRLRRFEQEARTASALSHPNVCTIYEVGDTRDGAEARRFIAMEYVAGESLRDLLARHRDAGTRPPLTQVLDVVAQAAAGLAAAHAAGVVHRDVKPENIMVRPDGLVKVLDFGLAKLARQGPPDGSAVAAISDVHTTPGTVLGTVRYMSPEQARGLPVDARTDVWSLGVVLYELLAGRVPFDGDTPSDVMVAVLGSELPSLVTLAPDVPEAVQRVVTSALQKPREARYQTAAELAGGIDDIRRTPAFGVVPSLPHENVPAGRTPVSTRLRAFGQSRWLPLAAAAALAGAAVWAGMHRVPAASTTAALGDQKYVVAVLPFQSLSADSARGYFSAGITEEVAAQLSHLAAVRVLRPEVLSAFGTSPGRIPRLAKELGVGSVVEGTIRAAGGQARITARVIEARSGQTMWSEQYERPLADTLAVQAQVARSIVAAVDASLTPSKARRAGRPAIVDLAAYDLYMRASKLSLGASQNATAVTMLRQAVTLDSTFAAAYSALARRYVFLSYGGGPAYLDSGLAAGHRAVDLDPDRANAYQALASMQGTAGQIKASRKSFLKALALQPNHLTAMLDLSVTLDMVGEYDESLHWAARGLAMAPTFPTAYYHVLSPLIRLDHRAAERLLAKAQQQFPGENRLELQRAVLDLFRGHDSAAIERARRVAGRDADDDEIHQFLGELSVLTHRADALALLEPLAVSSPETRSYMLPESMRSLYGWALARDGQRGRADTLWTQALAADQRDIAAGNEAPDRPMEIAAISAMRGDTTAALEWLERGYRAGFKDRQVLDRDPFFDSLRHSPRFRQIAATMEADIAAMRRRAAAERDTLFAIHS